jgi:hypothetical protein
VRHTDARRLTQSGTGKDDRNVTPELADAARDLVRRDPHRPFERPRTILPPAHIEHERPLRDQPQRDLRVDPTADGPNRRTKVETTRRRTPG